MVVLSDGPDPVERILSSGRKLDEYDYEILVSQLLNRSENDVAQLIRRLPWTNMTPDQIIRLFHELETYQEELAVGVSLSGFNAHELIDLVEGISVKAVKNLVPALRKVFPEAQFSLEDLELLVGLPKSEAVMLLRLAGPPVDLDRRQVLSEFRDGPEKVRQVLLHACSTADFFPELFQEAWSIDPGLVKRQMKLLHANDVGPFVHAAQEDKVLPIAIGGKEADLQFQGRELNSAFKSLSAAKKKAVMKYFENLKKSESAAG
jgi:hypothetical protein